MHSPGMVIIGAGLAGARAAQTLREAGYPGSVTLLGAESRSPYDRPPLSKAVLLGEQTPDACALHPAEYYWERGIDLRTDRAVVAIDRAAHQVKLADGSSLPYHRLLLTTGAEPRRLSLPGAALPGVLTLRTADDAAQLSQRLQAGQRLVLIGGGFIGLEVAASAVAAGCQVTVIEAGERLLMRAVPATIAACIEARHRAAGVQFRFGAQLVGLAGDGQVNGVTLAGGEAIACDTVLVGIGAVPRTALAEAAGLAVANGLVVDEHLATSDPDIYAAGDVCSFPHPLYGRIRLECWKNAEDQAAVAARNMLGEREPYRAVPWFWSDQYELSIQIAGLPQPDQQVVTREPSPGALLLFHLAADGSLMAASGIGPGNIGRDIRVAQMLIERGAKVSPEQLADPSLKLKSLLTAETA